MNVWMWWYFPQIYADFSRRSSQKVNQRKLAVYSICAHQRESRMPQFFWKKLERLKMKRFKCLDAVVFPADLRRFFTQIFAENQSAKSAVYSICADQRENQVLQTGKFIIRAHDHTPGNIYIRSMKLNGKTLKEPYIRFNDIVNGGLLELYMTAMPPKQP